LEGVHEIVSNWWDKQVPLLVGLVGQLLLLPLEPLDRELELVSFVAATA